MSRNKKDSIMFVSFLLVFLLVVLTLKLFSIGVDKINLNLRPIIICDNCSVIVNSDGTKIKENKNQGYNQTKELAKTSIGIGLNTKYTKVIERYNLKNNYILSKDKGINLSFIYYKKNNKWLIKKVDDNKIYNDELRYKFMFDEDEKLLSFEIYHYKA